MSLKTIYLNLTLCLLAILVISSGGGPGRPPARVAGNPPPPPQRPANPPPPPPPREETPPDADSQPSGEPGNPPPGSTPPNPPPANGGNPPPPPREETLPDDTSKNAPATPTATQPTPESNRQEASPAHQTVADLFSSNVSVTTTDRHVLITTQAIPADHEPGQFPMCADSNSDGRFDNPNEVVAQNLTFRIPRIPQLSDRITRLFPVIGIALNGVPLYGPGTAEGAVAVEAEVFDACNGHPDPTGVYHYHQNPSCSAGQQTLAGHAPLLGLAFDGFGIYGFKTGGPELDQCNGHLHDIDGDGDIDDQDYHYHVTDNPLAPILGCFRGIPERNDTGRGAFVGNGCR